jgi:hypothetical protein
MNPRRLQKYIAIIRTQLINSAAYPLDIATRSILIVMFMYILTHLVLEFRAQCQLGLTKLEICR